MPLFSDMMEAFTGPLRECMFNCTATIKAPPARATVDAMGHTTGSLSTLAENVPCSIEDLSGQELWSAQQSQPTATTRVTLAHIATVTPACWLVVGSRTLQVLSVSNVNQAGLILDLLCRERK